MADLLACILYISISLPVLRTLPFDSHPCAILSLDELDEILVSASRHVQSFVCAFSASLKMRPFVTSSLTLLSLASSQVSALAIPTESAVQKRGGYPFTKLVAFGDELSDNGNGSWAHGISGSTSYPIYGWGTWTDGPVAVQYLATLLDTPLNDYAFGGCCGGASFGATINNKYTPSKALYDGKPVPSVHQQIFYNYTKDGPPADIGKSLQFLWVGQNDLTIQTNSYLREWPANDEFVYNISHRITYNAEHLAKLGAPYVVIPNIYPKHLAPVNAKYLCKDNHACTEEMAGIIKKANNAIEKELMASKYAHKFIYYDVFNYMVDLINNKEKYGFTAPIQWYCDGDKTDPNYHWDECERGSYNWEGAQKFFWFDYGQATTGVYKLIAQDMKKTIDKHLGR